MNQNLKANLERWKKLYPLKAHLTLPSETKLLFCKTEQAELNLQRTSDGQIQYFHSQQGAAEEAKNWFSTLNLSNIQILYVSGIGLGYYYDAAKAWLREDSKRYLIFLEHDFEVIHRFFETETASQLLHDKQVRLRYVDTINLNDELWLSIAHYYGLMSYKISSLNSYLDFYPNLISGFTASIAYASELSKSFLFEFTSYGERFFLNFYQNILHLPDSYQANKLFGQFKGIPAIICGAGPSLDKNLALLETLGDKALIFAGGTAMNGVNVHNFLPHFGLGIDPNPSQMIRLIANKAFTTPYFYRNRLFPEAFRLIHGDVLYTAGSGGYDLSEYFEKELKIEAEKIEEGLNVINFNLTVAYMLGCSPIIFVGVDLAYTDQRSYPSGITAHASHDRRLDFRTKGIEDELLQTQDIYGNPTYTLWKWIRESTWFSDFSREHRDVTLINATEGGIGFATIPNLSLQASADIYLNKNFDFNTMIHGLIQNSSMPATVEKNKILELIKNLHNSLKRCEDYCQEISQELKAVAENLQQNQVQEVQDVLENFFSEKAQEHLKLLHEELAYTYILKSFDCDYPLLIKLEEEKISFEEGSIPNNEIRARRVTLQANRYGFLKNAARLNSITIDLAQYYQSLLQSKPPLSKVDLDQTKNNRHEQDSYLLENDLFILKDQELELSFCEKVSTQEHFGPEEQVALAKSGKYSINYPDGSPKIEQFYLKGHLHGPSTFFSATGTMLARTWYINGIREGKAWFYYLSGHLHSLRRYRHGMLEGKQEGYYPNGQLKTQISYQHGLLHGDVWLYYSNGELKRELHFIEGKRTGMDRMWNEASILILEGEYFNDQPIGIARIWYSTGKLLQEIVYDKDSQPISLKKWSGDGRLLTENEDDFFDKATKQLQLLTDSLEKITEHLNALAPLFNSSASQEIKNDAEELKAAIAHLNQLNKEVLFKSGLNHENVLEPIWKTPLSQEILKKQLDENTKIMSKIVSAMQILVAQIIKSISH